MYRAFALLQPGSTLTMAAVAEKLKDRFPQLNVERSGDAIALSGDDWDYQLQLVAGPEVKAESENFAAHISGLADDEHIANCDRRVEVWSDTPDPFMEHFDDHFQVLEVLRGFDRVVLIDPSEPGLL